MFVVLNGLRPLDAAAVEDIGAARIERAAGRDRGQTRHRTRDLRQPLCIGCESRNGSHQPLGIGMERVLHHLPDRTDLGETPDLGLILKPAILLPILGLALMALAPVLYRRFKRRTPPSGPRNG